AIMLLEKHGLFVTAGTADAALKLVRKVIKLCKSKLKEPESRKGERIADSDVAATKSAIRKVVLDTTGQTLPVTYFPKNRIVSAFMARKDASKLLATPALNPDELVYANGTPMWLQKCDIETVTKRLKLLIDRGQKPSAAFIVKGVGLFVAADKKTTPVIGEIAAGSLQIRMHAAKFGGILALNKRQQDFINNWEAEAFRKKLVSTKK
ncbi:MAG: hypothetical protein ACYSSN_10665, partial [Planctomycetota bacterium]